MNDGRQNARARRSAFTLVELLLVLVILAVLAAVVVPRVVGRSQQGRVTAAQTQISYFASALDMYEIDTGRFPTADQGLEALVEDPGVEGWNSSYLRADSVPLDPWGNEYVYQYPGRHNTDGYDIYSLGPDGLEGTADDVVNWSER